MSEISNLYFPIEEDENVTCSRPTIANGTVAPTNASIGQGESYEVSCSSGFILVGSDTVTCLYDETFDNYPVCTGIYYIRSFKKKWKGLL